MAKCKPYHSDSDESGQNREVHHDHDDCYEGKKIEAKHLEEWHWRQAALQRVHPARLADAFTERDLPMGSGWFVPVQDIPDAA